MQYMSNLGYSMLNPQQSHSGRGAAPGMMPNMMAGRGAGAGMMAGMMSGRGTAPGMTPGMAPGMTPGMAPGMAPNMMGQAQMQRQPSQDEGINMSPAEYHRTLAQHYKNLTKEHERMELVFLRAEREDVD